MLLLTLGLSAVFAQRAAAGGVAPASVGAALGSSSNTSSDAADLCAQVGYDAGFRIDRLVTAIAVGLAESGCRPLAAGHNGPTAGCPSGSTDRGLWQINGCYHPEVAVACAFDAACNARAAYRISSSGTDWTPWRTYDDGAYRAYLDEAGAAAGRLSAAESPAMAYDWGDWTMRIHRWASTGSAFTGPAAYTSGSFGLDQVQGRMASGDVNGDGTDDIVMAYQLTDGSGAFCFVVWDGGVTYAGRWYTSGTYTLAHVGDRLTVGDFNGDGKDDVAMAYDWGDGTMRIHRWTSTGTSFVGPSTYTSGSFDLSRVEGRMASGDVNGDGKDDIVMAYQNSDGTLSFHVWSAGSTYAGRWYTSGTYTLAHVGDRLTVGDYTGDGKAEVAMAYDWGDWTMRIHRWTSTGSAFVGPATYTSGSFGLDQVQGRMASGDVNGDGTDDIVMAYQLTDGSGAFVFPVWIGGLTYAGRWYTSGTYTLAHVGDRLTMGAW
jgi:lysozyme-like protein/VCBS repeat protein